MFFKVMDKVVVQSTSAMLKHLWGKQGSVVRVNYDTKSYLVKVEEGIIHCRSTEVCKLEE